MTLSRFSLAAVSLVGLTAMAAVTAALTPIVLMHGMGDSYQGYPVHCGKRLILRMSAIAEEIKAVLPEVFIYAVRIGDSPNADRLASYYDNLNRQVEEICQQLAHIDELREGFDAVGFSQGGQIMRAYVQRCNRPPVRNLITIGAQHQGVMDLPGCLPPDEAEQSAMVLAQVQFPQEDQPLGNDCGWWQRMVKKSIYADWVQDRIVQAQYFKDPLRYEEYLQKSRFLADINNERADRQPDYAARLKSLDRFVMFMFTNDRQVVPKHSAWFGYFDGKRLVPLREQQQYREDWLGLRSLDERGALVFREIHADHMVISREFIRNELVPLLGSSA